MGIFRFINDLVSDTYTDRNGYLRYQDSDKLLHRWAAEKKLGRKLRPGEVVHHKDRDKKNNSPGNLFVFRNQADHNRAHRVDAERYGWEVSYRGRKKESGIWGGTFAVLCVAVVFLVILKKGTPAV